MEQPSTLWKEQEWELAPADDESAVKTRPDYNFWAFPPSEIERERERERDIELLLMPKAEL